MSRISTDRPSADRGTRAGDGPFRRAIAVTVAVLLALVCTFIVLDYFQGPKLSSTQIDTSKVVAQTGQQLRLFADQNLATVAKSQVTVRPAAAFTVSTAGQSIAVQFTQRLNYATSYSVTVRGVTSAYQDQAQTFRYGFTTPHAELYYLDRADPASGAVNDDEIIRSSLRGTGRTVVYSAPHIQAFAAFPAVLAVVSLAGDGTSALTLASLDGGALERIVLPGPGTIQGLQASPAVGLLGFEFTSTGPASGRTYDSTLMTVDLGGAHTVQPVVGLDSKPLGVSDWLFLGGGENIVVQKFDQTVLLLDPSKPGSITPLGQFAELDNSSPDGSSIVVADAIGRMTLSIATAKTTRIPVLEVGRQHTFGGQLELLGSGTAWVQKVAVTGTGDAYVSLLVYEDGTSARILYRTVDDRGSIDDFRVSPNGQYVAISTVPDVSSSVSDGYAVNPKSTSITTVFVDIATGNVVRSVTGFDVDW